MSRKKPIRKLDEQTFRREKFLRRKVEEKSFHALFSPSEERLTLDEALLLRLHVLRLNGWFADSRNAVITQNASLMWRKFRIKSF